MNTTSLQGLRAFFAAARSGSFKVAAEEIFVSASAISHRIKNLEEQLGGPLFERQTRAIKLTDFGETLLQKVSPLIEQIDKEIESIMGLPPISTITLTLPPFFSTELLLPRLHNFTVKHKNIVINLDTVNGYANKHQETSDLSILLCDEKPIGFSAIKLFPLVLIPACSPDLTFNRNQPLSQVLENMTIIVHRPRRNAWKQWYKNQDFKTEAPRSVIVLDSMAAVVKAAEQGLGIALIPAALTKSRIAAGALEPLQGVELVTGDSYYLVSRKDEFRKSKVSKISEWIVKTFRSVDG